MVTTFFTANLLLKPAYLFQEQKYNKEYFLNETLEGINQEYNHCTGFRVTKAMKIQMDNCRVYEARKHCRQLAE
jgi:hypothetical protein